MSELLTIGEVSRRSGVAASALRFYEERGPDRAPSAPAPATAATARPVLRRIAFIVFAQRVGLTLEEIGAELAKLPAGPGADAPRLVAAVERVERRGSTSGSPSSSVSRPA